MVLTVALLATLSVMMVGCKDETRTPTTAPGADQKMGAEGVEVQNLITQLRSGTVDARQEAAEKIGDMKIRSQEAISALGNALRDSNEDVRQAAADALVKIQTSDSLRALRQGAQDMRTKGQQGAEDLQEKYNDAINDIRDEAKDGKQWATDMLNDLGEPVQKPEGSGPSIDVDIGT
jgi:dihydroxyacetone kinase-like predicted kinase